MRAAAEVSRPRPVPDTSSENYARAATAAGLAGAIALSFSGGAALASEAVIVAAPRALNYAASRSPPRSAPA